MKRLLIVAVLLLASCVRAPIEDAVTIEFHEGSAEATIVARRSFRLDSGSPADRARIASARDAAILGTDPWSIRFERLRPESERVTFDRDRGQLSRVTHSAVVPAEHVERFFSDVSLTVKVARGEGWGEMAIYPGTSNRATREQQRQFEADLQAWSAKVARYHSALNQLYTYMNENPQRARYLFAALIAERGVDGAPPLVTEEEQPYVDGVRIAMDAIAAAMDEQEGRASTFFEDADLIHNPFPAMLTIRVPGTIVVREGFKATSDGRGVVVEPIDLFESLAAMEEQWISPDPLAMLLRDESVTAEELAGMRRRSPPLTSAREIEDAIRAQLTRPETFLVRWRE